MKTEETITLYMNTHGSKDNVVYTWILWNFEKLDKIWKNEAIFCNDNLFEELTNEAYKDQFVVLLTNNGKYRACEPNIVKNETVKIKEQEYDWSKA